VTMFRPCHLALLQPSVSHQKSEARDQGARLLRVLVMLKREGWAVGRQRLPPLLAGRTAVAHEGQTPRTHQPEARPANICQRTESALEDGLRAR
jgi:hypothetical protein